MSSVVNSSSTPLAGDAEFTGAFEFLTVDKHGVEVVCSTDAPGNLVIEFSQNKTEINYSHTFTIDADVSFSRAVSKKGNYYRVRLVNGPSAQTTLQLVSIIQTTYQPDVLDIELDSATSSITMFGTDSTGTLRAVKTNSTGELIVSGGGSGGSDASAANQLIQIDIATNSNLVLTDIATATQDMLLSVDGINLKMNSLQTQQATYTIEAAASLAQATPSFTIPPSGIPKDEGWYYKNTAIGQSSQVYYYSYLNPALQVPGRQFAYTLGEITNSYAVVRILAVNADEGMPTLVIYTRPTGSGDYSPGFYKSRRVYNLPSGAKLSQGMKVLIWWGAISPPLKIHSDLERIQLQLAVSNGTLSNTEELAYLTINTDSAALAGNSEYILGAAGFQYGAEFCVDTVFTGESSSQSAGGDASAVNQLSSNTAVCTRLDLLTYSGSNLLVRDSQVSSEIASLNSTIGQGISVNMDTDPVVSGGVKLTGSTDGNLFVYDASGNATLGLVKDELITLNGIYTDLLAGTAQLSVALDATNDGVSLYAYNTTTLMPEPLTLSTDSGMKALDVHVVNQPSGYATESTLADISENLALTQFNVSGLSTCNTNDVTISTMPQQVFSQILTNESVIGGGYTTAAFDILHFNNLGVYCTCGSVSNGGSWTLQVSPDTNIWVSTFNSMYFNALPNQTQTINASALNARYVRLLVDNSFTATTVNLWMWAK